MSCLLEHDIFITNKFSLFVLQNRKVRDIIEITNRCLRKAAVEMKNFMLIFVICLTVYFGHGILNMEASNVPMYKQQVIVHSGDTLWSIASRWTEKDEDVREVLYRIQQENPLNSKAFLQPGQRIIVPVRASNEVLVRK
jgi:hypothetical protein